MITFLTATPGGGKSLLATEMLYKISKANVLNLKHNYFYAKSFFEKIAELKLEQYFQSIIIEVGQGLEKTSQHIFLEDDYFDFLKTEYYINVVMDGFTDDIIQNYPPYYFERVSIILNEIIKNINKEQNTKFLPFKPVRTIYTNIANLRLSQARPLPKDMDWRLTPQGSYFVVDECQLIEIFSEESRKIDPIVKDLTIHRHKGYDFLFITQDPSFVHKYIRKLASLHIHLVNIFGWEQSMRMEWSTVQEVPNAARSLIRAENVSRWVFPKHIYKLYQSTTIDTRVKRIPKKLVTLVVFAVLLFIAAFFISGGQSTVLSAFSGKPLDTEEVKKMNQLNQQTLLNQVDLLLNQYQSLELQITLKQNRHYLLLGLFLVIPFLLTLFLPNPDQMELLYKAGVIQQPLSMIQTSLMTSYLFLLPLWSIIVFLRVVFVYRKNAMQQINREQNLLESLEKLAGRYSISRVTDHLIILDNRPLMQDYLNNLRNNRQNKQPKTNAI